MRTLFLPAPSSRSDQSDLQSDRDSKTTCSCFVGTVLARRYKILERIGVDSFKAHDLALDQTVRVRQALLTSQRAGDTWRQKVQQLALVRDPNFLNVLDVIFDKSSDFVITERPQGHSLADLLSERSRLDPADVLRLVTPLAGALDLAAPFSCCPNPISTCWLFTETRSSCARDPEQRSLSDWPPFLVKLDVWELVRPRKNNAWPFLTSNAPSGCSRSFAVRQAALLVYELLGGIKKTDGEVKRWFKPVNGLGDAGNSILYLGLQGSPRFKSCECFFQKLKSANQSGKQESRALPASALASQENSVFLPDTNDAIRKFNRDTRWVATGVLGAVVFAGLMLALLVQERYPHAVHHSGEAVQAGGNLLLNTNVATLAESVVLTGKGSTGEIAPGQAISVDQAFTNISTKENPSSQMEAAASTPTPVLAFTPEINRHDVEATADFWTPAHRQDAGRVIGLNVPHRISRSSVRPRFVDVKMRLIMLWHQSLARSEKSRSWTAFSNSNKGERRKVGYTAETDH
jgi:hypothetical protein